MLFGKYNTPRKKRDIKSVIQFLIPVFHDLPITLWMLAYGYLFYPWWDENLDLSYAIEFVVFVLLQLLFGLYIRLLTGKQSYAWLLARVILGILSIPALYLWLLFIYFRAMT